MGWIKRNPMICVAVVVGTALAAIPALAFGQSEIALWTGLPELVLGQAAAEVPTPWWIYAITGGVTILGGLGVWSLARGKLGALFDWLAHKTHLGFLSNVDEVLVGFAKDLYHSEIRVMKASGRWDKATQQHMLGILVKKAKQHFGLGALMKITAGEGDEGVDDYLRSRAHVAVSEAKARGRVAKGATPKNPPGGSTSG